MHIITRNMILRAIGALALVIACLLPVTAHAAPAPQQACDRTGGALLAQLLTIDAALEDAARTGDIEAWKARASDDFTGFEPIYQALIQDKADAISALPAAWASHYHPAGGDRIIARAPSFAEARRYGDIAILTYIATEAVKTEDGRVKAGDNAKTTKIFLKEGADWRLVHSDVSVDRDALTAVTLGGKPAPTPSAADQALQDALIAAEIAMEPGSRHNDTAIWRSQVVDNYSEFNSYYPYPLQTTALNMAIQAAMDRNLPAKPHQNSVRHYRVKRYGNVALLIFAAAEKGEVLDRGPRSKFTFVFVSIKGRWILAHVHADWVMS